MPIGGGIDRIWLGWGNGQVGSFKPLQTYGWVGYTATVFKSQAADDFSLLDLIYLLTDVILPCDNPKIWARAWRTNGSQTMLFARADVIRDGFAHLEKMITEGSI